ncbi:DUF397 domain-containing protein [Streptomyces sp. NPDC051582]|uniref:DUF397 domain-containing protein n=1 Tax=Streptomyces sp. NPDC051582 TaxID=3155167 RepID=UPI0034437736
MIHEHELAWFKSSYSDSDDVNDCVEAAPTPTGIHVRDTKAVPGPVLTFGAGAWAGFIAHAASR